MKKTDLLKGFFDVRRYKDGTPREQWQMKGNDENIEFSCVLDERTAREMELMTFARTFTAPPLGNACRVRELARIKFKIGRNTRWFNADGVEVDRPDNADLDGSEFAVRMLFNEVVPPAGASAMSPRGNWVRSIQFREVAASFAPITEQDVNKANSMPIELPETQTQSEMPTASELPETQTGIQSDILDLSLPF